MLDQDSNQAHDYIVDPGGHVRVVAQRDASVAAVWTAVAPLAQRLARLFDIEVGFAGTGAAAAFTLTGLGSEPEPVFEIYDRYRGGKLSQLVLANLSRCGRNSVTARRVVEQHVEFARESGLRWCVLEHPDPLTLDIGRGLHFASGQELLHTVVDGAVLLPAAWDLDAWYLDLRASAPTACRELVGGGSAYA